VTVDTDDPLLDLAVDAEVPSDVSERVAPDVVSHARSDERDQSSSAPRTVAGASELVDLDDHDPVVVGSAGGQRARERVALPES
jgi:hypothetical protein